MQNVSKQSGAKATDLFNTRFSRSLVRLTALYTGILAIILFTSSAVSYSAFSERVGRRFDRMPPPAVMIKQNGIIQTITPRGPTIQEVRADFIRSLVIVNGILLILAGILSYFLAHITLRPIKRAYEEQQRFLSDASHELRTPLAILKLELENERERSDLSASGSERITSNLEEVDRMSNLVDDLLVLSRLDEHQSIALESTDITRIIRDLVQRFKTLADKQQISLSAKEHSNHLLTANTNSDILSKALGNVIKNAITYNRPNGTVNIHTYQTNKNAGIKIIDTGIGMTSKDTAHIFDRFYRADESRTRATGGSGLGLSIVRSSILSLGGTVTVESEVGKGTTIIIELPKS